MEPQPEVQQPKQEEGKGSVCEEQQEKEQPQVPPEYAPATQGEGSAVEPKQKAPELVDDDVLKVGVNGLLFLLCSVQDIL